MTKYEQVKVQIEKLYPSLTKWTMRRYGDFGLDYAHSAVVSILERYVEQNKQPLPTDLEMKGLLEIEVKRAYNAYYKQWFNCQGLDEYSDQFTDKGRKQKQMEGRRLLTQLAKFLKPLHRNILVRIYIHGDTRGEVAKRYKINIKTVARYHHQALTKAANIMNNELAEMERTA